MNQAENQTSPRTRMGKRHTRTEEEDEPTSKTSTTSKGKVLPDQNVLAASDASNATGVRPTPVCPPTPQRTPAFLTGRSRLKRQNSLTDTRALLDESGTESPSIQPHMQVSWLNSFRDPTILGKGSFSVVFRAVSTDDEQEYAVKRTLRQFRSRSERASILHEFRVSQVLGYHPNIIHYKLAWQEEGHVYMQMDLCELGSVSSLLKKEEYCPLPEETIWNFIKAVADGLNYLHQRELIHLDIKPDNIFIDKAGTLKIGDLGLVRVNVKENDESHHNDTNNEFTGIALNMSEPISHEREDDTGEDTSLHVDKLIGSNEATPTKCLDISRISSFSESNEDCCCIDDLKPKRPVPRRPDASQNAETGHNISSSALTHLSSPQDEEGDVRYMAAELLNTGNCKPAADIFSLGMSVLEMIYSYKLPQDGEAWHAIREGKLPPLPEELQPASLDESIKHRMMSTDENANHSMWRKRSFSTENYRWSLRRSNALLSLLVQMIDPVPEKRPTADKILEEAKKHSSDAKIDPMMSSFVQESSKRDSSVISRREPTKIQREDTTFPPESTKGTFPAKTYTPGSRKKGRRLELHELEGSEIHANRSNERTTSCYGPHEFMSSTSQRANSQTTTQQWSPVTKRGDSIFTELSYTPTKKPTEDTPDVIRNSGDEMVTPDTEPHKRSFQAFTEPQNNSSLPSLYSVSGTPDCKTKSKMCGSLTGKKSQRAGRISPAEDFSVDLSRKFESLHTTSKCFAGQALNENTLKESPQRIRNIRRSSGSAAPAEVLSPRSRREVFEEIDEEDEFNDDTNATIQKPSVDTESAEIEAANAENFENDFGSGLPPRPFPPSVNSNSNFGVNGNPVPFPIRVNNSMTRLRSHSQDGRETPSYRSRENSLSSISSWANHGDAHRESFPRRLGLYPSMSPSPGCETPNQPVQYNWEI